MARLFNNRRQNFTNKKQHITLEKINESVNKHKIYVIIGSIIYCLILSSFCLIIFWDYF